MKQIFIFSFLLIFILLKSTIINVPTDKATIQEGIDVAVNGDIVLVQSGTYLENINFNGKLITVASLYLTTADSSYISSTIIDGDGSGSVVTFESEEDVTAILCGFTITNGLAVNGGGIYCIGLCYPKIHNVTITGNTATGTGGGIFCDSSSPYIENVTISNNSADSDGGGIYCYVNSSPYIHYVTITGNTATDTGGGISSYSSSMNLQNVSISNNSADIGGGIYSYNNDNPTLWNVIISENTANSGGGIYCAENGFPNLHFVTITDNTAQSGGGILGSDGTFTNLENSIVWNNSPNELFNTAEVAISYSDIMGGESGIIGNGVVYWNNGNIDSDPLFVDSVNGDYHLTVDSPCIDTGDPISPLDPDGTRADMGAFFYDQDEPPLPVNLSSFYALYMDSTPNLYWTTQTEDNNAYWNVYRGTSDNFNQAMWLNENNPVPGNGTTNYPSEYEYEDVQPVTQNTTYWYWLEDVSFNGSSEVHEPITLTIPEDTPVTPNYYGLQQNYPNPFNPSTSINFILQEESDVEVIVYNVKGERIQTIFNEYVYANQTIIAIWDGKDSNAKQVSTGIYFYKLKTGNYEKTKRMVLLK